MTEASEQMNLEREIEAVRTAEGYLGLNNFRVILPGGYRYKELARNPEYGNNAKEGSMKGLSLREFTVKANTIRESLGIDQVKVEQLQEEAIKKHDKKSLQKLNDYIFPLYRQLRLDGFSHADCAS